MNIHTFKDEYTSLSNDRKVRGLRALTNALTDDIVEGTHYLENLVFDILDLAELAEENDYFGTEGLNV
jgi:hypothetical protein